MIYALRKCERAPSSARLGFGLLCVALLRSARLAAAANQPPLATLAPKQTPTGGAQVRAGVARCLLVCNVKQPAPLGLPARRLLLASGRLCGQCACACARASHSSVASGARKRRNNNNRPAGGPPDHAPAGCRRHLRRRRRPLRRTARSARARAPTPSTHRCMRGAAAASAVCANICPQLGRRSTQIDSDASRLQIESAILPLERRGLSRAF